MALLSLLSPTPGTHVGDLRWYCGPLNTTGLYLVGNGWMAANGVELSRTTYALLFGEVGTAYGAPTGSTFLVPNCTDAKNMIPKGGANFTIRGATGGEYTHVLTQAEEPNHSHSYGDTFAPRSGSGSFNMSTGHFATWGADRGETTTVAGGQGGGAATAHQNMPPIQTVGGVIIRYL